MTWEDYIPQDIPALYDVYDYKHAAAILCNEFPREFSEVCDALRAFRLTDKCVRDPGGSESAIPKMFSAILRPMGWRQDRLTARLIVDGQELSVETHIVDYIKGRVAFDVEWNSKDQTYDRDLYAFRAFFELNRISVAVLVTRSNELDPWFKKLGLYQKYGASTTQMNKLLPRLDAGRNGGCPVLVFGITTRLLKES